MPPKKRTDQSKRTPSTSPTTSVAHTSADQHHRLRHTGPSIGTSAGSTTSPKSPTRAHFEPTPETPSTLEASRGKKGVVDVPPPGSRTSFTKALYVLVFVVLFLLSWYIYGIITLLEKLKEEVGWWGIISGDYSGGTVRWETSEGSGVRWDWPGAQRPRARTEEDGELERSLNALADTLGISPMQVAFAIKPLVPRANLKSITLKTGETGGSEAVRILLEDTMRNDEEGPRASRMAAEFAERSGEDTASENAAEGVVA